MPLSWFYGLEACFCIGVELISLNCAILPLVGFGSADTSQPPKGEICMDKSH